MNLIIGFFAGAFVFTTGKAFVRPVAKGAIKGVILLGRKVQELQAEVAEEIMDLKAEAENEIKEEDHKEEGHKEQPYKH